MTMRFFVFVMLICCYIFCITGISTSARGQEIILELGQEKPKPRWLALPYVFYTDSLELAYGIAGGTSGHFQDQMSIFGALLGSTNDSHAGYLFIDDFQLPFIKRMFFDFNGSFGYFTDQRAYVGYNPEFPGERAGSNESSNDNYISGKGEENWVDITFRYVFPIGHAKDSAISRYVLDRGFLHSGASGGELWNPFRSGRTSLDLIYFAREREIEDQIVETKGTSNGTLFAVEYDNRDFSANPSKGSFTRSGLAHDYDLSSSSGSWTVIDVDFRKYFSLGQNGKFRQQVLALNVWTANTPTWEVKRTQDDLPIIEGRPPLYLGASLGGFNRLKAYPFNRFSDKSAIYYAAEYRLTPNWNPLGDISWLKFLDIDWWQFVPFAEIGRVAPEWSLNELHSDMKWDVGVGIRFMAQKAVVRLDTAFTSDAWSTWAMIGHPF